MSEALAYRLGQRRSIRSTVDHLNIVSFTPRKKRCLILERQTLAKNRPVASALINPSPVAAGSLGADLNQWS